MSFSKLDEAASFDVRLNCPPNDPIAIHVSRRDRSYSDAHSLHPSTNYSNATCLNDGNREVDKTRVRAKMAADANHSHRGNRPRSKSESEYHFYRRSSPTHKKKHAGHHQHAKHSVGNSHSPGHRNPNSPILSPMMSPKNNRSLGKMWIRPVPIRHRVQNQVGQGIKSTSSSELPYLPGLFSDANYASNLDSPKAAPHDLTMSPQQVTPSPPAMNCSATMPLEHQVRQVSNDSSGPQLGESASSPVSIPLWYTSPNSSFNYFHRRGSTSPYYHHPLGTMASPSMVMAFGESGKPIAHFNLSSATSVEYDSNYDHSYT